jgi:hypothetical protein
VRALVRTPGTDRRQGRIPPTCRSGADRRGGGRHDSRERTDARRHGKERGDGVVLGDEVDQVADVAVLLRRREHLHVRRRPRWLNLEEGLQFCSQALGVVQVEYHGTMVAPPARPVRRLLVQCIVRIPIDGSALACLRHPSRHNDVGETDSATRRAGDTRRPGASTPARDGSFGAPSDRDSRVEGLGGRTAPGVAPGAVLNRRRARRRRRGVQASLLGHS